MEDDQIEDMDIEVVPSMWPEDIDSEKPYNIEKPRGDQDMLEEANAVRLLREELDILSQQRQEVELKKLEILENFRFEEEGYGGDKRPISILDEVIDIYQDLPRRKKDVIVQNNRVEIEAEYDTVAYWKQRAMHLETLLEASIQREQALIEKLQESDKELRYRFIYNHFPRLQEEDILGKTDMEIFSGVGVKESQDFKREVLEKGLPAKREITFETELFGKKIFLIYVEPVFSKSGETIGINYMGMDVTDQWLSLPRVDFPIRVPSDLALLCLFAEETMRAKQMLATMSHEIRSPLSGVVSMAEILSATNLDREQRQLLNVMISSGDLVLQLINDILDLSKVESGVMKLEATKFHPRQVVKHVLQTAAASLQKILTLEGHIADDVPIEVIGDVLRIRQILTNLISNAIKFTHEGKVGINLYVVPDPCFGKAEGNHQKSSAVQSTTNASKEEKCTSASQINNDQNGSHTPRQNHAHDDEPITPVRTGNAADGDKQEEPQLPETVVWLRCDVYDTGIGIPGAYLSCLTP
ncbi:hypothetical protein GH714_008563 [Hevea brasiliensis]|uniref:histidine kinase n=1 Tax=Hevea brasiliensis TaxID=3981 RepID=A0A6A6LN02_HEVBR|nr:hypothetical protein GH714_008563 [Hevea brasiliensis]